MGDSVYLFVSSLTAIVSIVALILIVGMRASAQRSQREAREDIASGFRSSSDSLNNNLEAIGRVQHERLEVLHKRLQDLDMSSRSSLDSIRNTMDGRIRELQESNEKKLSEMRKTVDEKLHETLEKRLGESFALVSQRLDAVHKGLGEMQTLATGVGDLKRVLSNVKTRGTWAEIQLGGLLEQILSPGQYERNVCVSSGSQERVEYAIKLPGPKTSPGSVVWLPIDSKFPQEDWIRLQDATERMDHDGVAHAEEALVKTVRLAAKDISSKYVNPPETTDFAIMFLATEGLYAEVLRKPILVDELQLKYRIVVAGPSNLIALLSSLRMGFQTLAIEQRASEVWRVLAAVKTEFGKFGDTLDKVKRQLNTASKTIEDTGVRTRVLERQLRNVEQLPDAEAAEIIGLSVSDDIRVDP